MDERLLWARLFHDLGGLRWGLWEFLSLWGWRRSKEGWYHRTPGWAGGSAGVSGAREWREAVAVPGLRPKGHGVWRDVVVGKLGRRGCQGETSVLAEWSNSCRTEGGGLGRARRGDSRVWRAERPAYL